MQHVVVQCVRVTLVTGPGRPRQTGGRAREIHVVARGRHHRPYSCTGPSVGKD